MREVTAVSARVPPMLKADFDRVDFAGDGKPRQPTPVRLVGFAP